MSKEDMSDMPVEMNTYMRPDGRVFRTGDSVAVEGWQSQWTIVQILDIGPEACRPEAYRAWGVLWNKHTREIRLRALLCIEPSPRPRFLRGSMVTHARTGLVYVVDSITESGEGRMYHTEAKYFRESELQPYLAPKEKP